jgi:hypothetical protein
MSLYAFHLGQIISTVLGQVDHDGHNPKTSLTTPQNDAFVILLSTKP